LPAFLACDRNDKTGLAGALMPLAEGGDPRAQAWVAYLLGAGSGGSFDLRVQHNLQHSARWYAKAAEQGLPSAMYDYGVVLEHGMGVPVDVAAARRWYEKAAAEGFERADEALATVGSAQP
jgi:TPR repeat protein